SILFNLAGDLIAPLLNRNAIKAEFYSANSKQIQAAYKYEQTILNAYVEVYNQVSNISNLNESFALRKKQVDALSESVNIANKLFQSAEADYMEVLMTQRDALESRLDLIETKTEQLRATIQLYKALGGGWK
ncbi:MAG: TolC family protein, partial [Crocinitomicaceae bacterium]